MQFPREICRIGDLFVILKGKQGYENLRLHPLFRLRKPVPAVRHVAVGPFRPEYCRLRRRRAAPVRRRRPAAAHTRRAGTFRNADVQHRRFGGGDVRQRHPLRGAAGAGALSGSDGRTIRRHLRRPGIPHHVRGADLRRAAHLRGGDSAVAARRRLPAVAPGRRIRRTARSRIGRRAGLHLLAAGQPPHRRPRRTGQRMAFRQRRAARYPTARGAGRTGQPDARGISPGNQRQPLLPAGRGTHLRGDLRARRWHHLLLRHGDDLVRHGRRIARTRRLRHDRRGLEPRRPRALPAAPHAAGNRHPPDGRRLFRNGGTAPARRERVHRHGRRFSPRPALRPAAADRRDPARTTRKIRFNNS